MGCGVHTKEYIKSKMIMLKVDRILLIEKREEMMKKYISITGQNYIDEGIEYIQPSIMKDKANKSKEKEKDIELHETKTHTSCKSSRKPSERMEEVPENENENENGAEGEEERLELVEEDEESNKNIRPIQLKCYSSGIKLNA